MSNPLPMSQAMSRGDTRWKTLTRVKVSGAQFAIVSQWPQERRLKKPTVLNTAGRAELEGIKAESALPQDAGRQAGSLVDSFILFIRISIA